MQTAERGKRGETIAMPRVHMWGANYYDNMTVDLTLVRKIERELGDRLVSMIPVSDTTTQVWEQWQSGTRALHD